MDLRPEPLADPSEDADVTESVAHAEQWRDCHVRCRAMQGG